MQLVEAAPAPAAAEAAPDRPSATSSLKRKLARSPTLFHLRIRVAKEGGRETRETAVDSLAM